MPQNVSQIVPLVFWLVIQLQRHISAFNPTFIGYRCCLVFIWLVSPPSWLVDPDSVARAAMQTLH